MKKRVLGILIVSILLFSTRLTLAENVQDEPFATNPIPPSLLDSSADHATPNSSDPGQPVHPMAEPNAAPSPLQVFGQQLTQVSNAKNLPSARALADQAVTSLAQSVGQYSQWQSSARKADARILAWLGSRGYDVQALRSLQALSQKQVAARLKKSDAVELKMNQIQLDPNAPALWLSSHREALGEIARLQRPSLETQKFTKALLQAAASSGDSMILNALKSRRQLEARIAQIHKDIHGDDDSAGWLRYSKDAIALIADGQPQN